MDSLALMTPVHFPEVNILFGPPQDLEESQVQTIPGFAGQTQGGSCDGLPLTVVAYQLTKEEAQHLMDGGLLFFSMIGGLAPHYPSLDFHTATHPA